MNDQVQQLLLELETWGKEHDTHEAEHSKRMLNLEPDTAQLISIFIQSGQRTRILEIGTSNGYSTIWLASATQTTAGHVTSIEHSPEKWAMAVENLKRAGLSERATLLQGDARDVLEWLEGAYDLVFLDANRSQYPSLLPLLLLRLAPGGLVLADNVHSHAREIADYLNAIRSDPHFAHVVVGVGKGLSVAYKLT
jgi:predicted O-methyltransferase YrrM